MPEHYSNSKSVPKGFHRMPDGSLMKGDKHPKSKPRQTRKDAKPPAKSGSKPRAKKESEEGLPLDTMKEGSLKRMLKIKKDDPPLKVSELNALLRIKDNQSGSFRGRSVKMTPLMRKRANLGKTLIKLPKK